MLTIYKASAGSGKTFQLVVEYLRLLIENPFNYKHILAVTFTNKATNEMKGRILEQLFKLGSNQKSPYLESLQKELGCSEEHVRQRAQHVLKNILHDFNRFSINTIDSFTQRVIKAFNRELGISPNFALELDDSLILEEAVDNLLSKIDRDKKLLDWLVKFSEEKITENQSQRIEDDIKSLGRELFKEKFQVFFPQNDNPVYTRENLTAFKKELNKIIRPFEAMLKKKGAEAIQIINDHGFTTSDFSFNLSGIAGYFKKLSEGEIKEAGSRVLAAEESAEKWISKTHKQKAELLVLVENLLQPVLRDILIFFRNNSTQYYSAVAVNSQLRMLGILTDLKEEIKLLLNEKSMLQISDSNLLLSKIIGESESPFVYEKIGNYFNYFMLDEFQDTSTLQWNNFKPLIDNSLGEGNRNLLVGDVKQSIYRWRNSDWNILAEQVEKDFPLYQSEIKNLKKNWRSDKNIIAFNNAIIGNLKNAFVEILFAESNDDYWLTLKEKFAQVYSDFQQEPGDESAEEKGLAEVHFLAEEDFESESLKQLVEQVKMLQDNGLKAADISILIRRNKEGTKIIETFLAAAKIKENRNYNLSVLSNESLFLHASKATLFVIFLVELLIDQENLITKTALMHLWTSWLKPELAKQGITLLPPLGNQTQIDFSSQPEGTWQLDKNVEEVFIKELGQKFSEVKQKVLLTSIDETITEICAHFQLFSLASELPFLQTLIDKSAEIKISISNDLSNFIYWWNEKGKFTSVNVNDEVDSIRLLTVHKSKGLEFKAVLIPFLDWNTSWSGNLSPVLWCQTSGAPFNQFPLLPVKAASDLENTIFKIDYFEEKVSYFIDTLNLLYVAFTRAESALIIHAPDSKKPGKSANSLLKYALQQMNETDTFSSSWSETENIFRYGRFVHEKKDIVPATKSEIIQRYYYHSFGERVKLRLSGEDFLLLGEKHQSVKNAGKIMHEILAEVETINDVEKACLKAFYEGIIDNTEMEQMIKSLQEKLQNPEVTSWFDGTFTTINERDLLTRKNVLRPDRIMFSGEEAVVVDFKTGEKKQDKYNLQIKRYTKILKETGFSKVKGYLWYLHLNEVEKVAEY